jgi:type II secretory pathway component GspD/PulD (secretin)
MHGQRFEQSQVTYVESPPGSGNYTATANITPTRTVNDTIDKGKSISSDLSDQFTKSVTDMKSAILSAADFQATLAALKQVNGVSIVSDPKIIVANEQTALIHIGDRRRPFVSSVTPGQQGIAPVVSYNPGEPVDTGVKLMVTPTINTSSNITVKIEPELTSLTGVDTAPNGQTYPIISTKKITTVFCLESGKTVAIGGLTQNTEKKSSSKVPLLGDIPLIGKYLFSWSSTEKDQDETIIFVTVCLATPESIQKEDGLPEDTELARKQLIMAALKKQQLDAQMKELKENASSEADSAKAMKIKDRLLRRTD